MTSWAYVRERARLADTSVAAVATLLGLLCLIPLFEDLRWLAPAVVMVAVVATLGAASRAIALPIPLIPVVEVLGIIGTITAMFAAEEAWARILPTSPAWDVLRALTRAGMVDSAALAAPVPTAPQLVLLAVGGAGLAAMSIDVLFVSVRSPMLAGIPLLTLFLGSSFMQFGRSPWWLFPPAAIGWLLILAADQRDRIREWGVLDPTTRIRGLSAAARRTGAVAIVLAMVAAIVLPVRATTALKGTGGVSDTGGGVAAARVILDPLVSMRRNLVLATDTQVLRYETGNPRPPYLRVTALEAFDGVTWSPRSDLANGRSEGIPLPGNVLDRLAEPNPTYFVRGGTSFRYGITVTNLENSYLPLPYPIATLDDVSGLADDWTLDPDTGIAFSRDVPATGLQYEVTAMDPSLKSADLRNATSRDGSLFPQLEVPPGISPEVRRLANEVTADAASPYEKAIALQRWFTRDGGFEYSTDVRSGADADYLAEFLNDRIGYCEQFASSMALMARTLGIPSRVVVGFTQGSKVAGDVWEVTVRDAHAWPELWFDSVGWVRFEPTPRSGATVQAPAYAPAPSAIDESTSDGSPQGALGTDERTPVTVVVEASPRQRLSVALAIVLGVGLAVVLIVPMVRRFVRRRRRLFAGTYDGVVAGAWADLADTAVDLGMPWSDAHTPRQIARRLGAGMAPPAGAALNRLRAQVEQSRYARRTAMSDADVALSRERSAAVRADVRAVVADWRERVTWRTRLASYCWPPSARRRQRSSSRSMNPGDLRLGGADGLVGAASSTGRTLKDE